MKYLPRDIAFAKMQAMVAVRSSRALNSADLLSREMTHPKEVNRGDDMGTSNVMRLRRATVCLLQFAPLVSGRSRASLKNRRYGPQSAMIVPGRSHVGQCLHRAGDRVGRNPKALATSFRSCRT